MSQKESRNRFNVACFGFFNTDCMRYALYDHARIRPIKCKIYYVRTSAYVRLSSTNTSSKCHAQKWVEHYKGSTWFKATFLYVFSWLAVSFLLINPPMGDIVAPNVSSNPKHNHGGWRRRSRLQDGRIRVLNITQGYNDSWIVMAFSDNDDPSHATYNATLSNVTNHGRFLMNHQNSTS